MQDVVLDETAPTGGGKKNKKKRGKAANPVDDKDPEKMGEEFNTKINTEIEKAKKDFEKDKADLLTQKTAIEKRCKEIQE